MTTYQTALLAISVTSATYGALSLTYAGVLATRAVMATKRKVGGITFLRIGRYQVSFCKPRTVPADRVAKVTRRAQTSEARRLDAIASRWCNG